MIRDISKSRNSFSRYARLLLRLHDAISEGRGDSDDADAIRDEMDRAWNMLDAESVGLVNGLSADLYALNGSGDSAQVALPNAHVAQFDRALFDEAWQREDWSEALRIIRANVTSLAADEVASIRAAFWLYLGEPMVALTFFRYLERLRSERMKGQEPLTVDEEGLLLNCLNQLADHDELQQQALRRADRLAARTDDPIALYVAAETWFQYATNVFAIREEAAHRRAIELGQRCVSACQAAEKTEFAWAQATIELHIALSHEALGELEFAQAACNRALAIAPTDSDALQFYGYLMKYSRLSGNTPLGTDEQLRMRTRFRHDLESRDSRLAEYALSKHA
ncbi:MAG: hypothetical protein KDA62_09050 [Planctomycetales bacterium]|nr:hypothetical protein [Planctomycetales bacterium]